ncbi:uncharacterized protein DS421_20g700800 [Arachis hypogaea]|nr:uncharacterized protein DS421_20g700800 [Arachis hypogaea]
MWRFNTDHQWRIDRGIYGVLRRLFSSKGRVLGRHPWAPHGSRLGNEENRGRSRLNGDCGYYQQL